MALSNNNLNVVFSAKRQSVNRGDKELAVPRTLDNVKEFQIVEQTILAGEAGVAVNFGPVGSADGVIIYSPTKVGLHLNGSSAPEVVCGSLFVALDTLVTSLHIDNDLLATPADVTVEVWLIALTG